MKNKVLHLLITLLINPEPNYVKCWARK